MPRIAISFVALILIAATALADTSWGRHMDAGEWAFAGRNFEVAETEFRAALEIAQKLPPGDIRLEESLRSLGLVYEYQSRYEEAQPLFLLLLAAQEHRLGATSPELLDTLAAVARTSVPAGDPPNAREALERYTAIADASDAGGDEQHRLILSTLARMNIIEERPEDALALQRRVVSMALTNDGLEPAEQADPLITLAQLEIQVGEPERARELVDQAVAIQREHNSDFDAFPVLVEAAQQAFGHARPDLAAAFANAALAETSPGSVEHIRALQVAADAAWLPVRRSTDAIGDLLAAAQPSPELTAARQAQVSYLNALPDDPSFVGPRVTGLQRLLKITALQGDVDATVAVQNQIIDTHRAVAGPTSVAALAALQDKADIYRAADRPDRESQVLAELIREQAAAWAEDARRLPAMNRQLELLTELREKKAARALKKDIRHLEKALR
jgi:tetratricopeptide (TPR) repeat protein